MSKIEDFLQSAAHYYEIRYAINQLLTEIIDEIKYHDLSDEEKTLLYKMLKDPFFELKMFEFFLKNDISIALEYLNKYYLEGSPIEDKTRYQTNLDVMFDDMKDILGNEKFEYILRNIPADTRQFFPIKKATKFAYDIDSDEDLPAWY